MKIRKGKLIHFRMCVLTDGEKLPLEGRDITFEISDTFGRKTELPVAVSGSVLGADFLPEQQKCIGPYMATVWENKGKDNQVPVDIVPAVILVRYTTEENRTKECTNLEVETVDLGVADIGKGEITDMLFAVQEVKELSDTDYLVVRTAEGVRKISAKSLRDYCNYGLTIKF